MPNKSASVRYVAFLRGINLGRRRLTMDRLAAEFEAMGFADVATFIASGNVLFTSPNPDIAKLESRIAAHLEQALGYDVDTFVRPIPAVAAIARSKPFPDDGKPGATTTVAFLHEPLSPERSCALAAIRSAHDEFRVLGSEFYWLCRTRTSESLIWKNPDMRALKLPTCTMRNMTSIRKLVAKHAAAMA